MTRAAESVKHYESSSLAHLDHALSCLEIHAEVAAGSFRTQAQESVKLVKIMILSKEYNVCALYAEHYLDATDFDMNEARFLMNCDE